VTTAKPVTAKIKSAKLNLGKLALEGWEDMSSGAGTSIP